MSWARQEKPRGEAGGTAPFHILLVSKWLEASQPLDPALSLGQLGRCLRGGGNARVQHIEIHDRSDSLQLFCSSWKTRVLIPRLTKNFGVSGR